MIERVWSWAATLEDVEARRWPAAGLVGGKLVTVTDVGID
jgi:hypothetical protein